MFEFLRSLFRHPFDNANLSKRARDISFRLLEDADIPTCIGFYRANEAAHFPPGLVDYYESKLRAREMLTLIATRNGTPVGCCSITCATSKEGMPVATLCFGLVDPAHQRQGIGTAQLLVRLALLTTTKEVAVAALLAVPGSVSFYRKHGFDFRRTTRGDDGRTYPLGVLVVSKGLIDHCRTQLAKRNIKYPDVSHLIPRKERSKGETDSTSTEAH